MKKTFSFLTLSIVIFLTILSFVSKSAWADGMMIKLNPYSDRWEYAGENNQQAFINYDNGLQKMIIGVGLDGENSNDVVWLFPVPANPNKVAIDIVNSLPLLSGEEISEKARSNLDDVKRSLQMTQLYTFPFTSLYGTLNSTNRGMDSTLVVMSKTGKAIESDVVVYEHLSKEGISSEVITAKTANGLYDYLKNRGLKIENGSIPVLNNYIGKEYSFVISWISSPEQIISTNQRGVFVTFPTKDIYFPLLPTSVYGSKIVPATLRIIGHVSPKVFQDIRGYTKTNYYINSYPVFSEDLKNFYREQSKNIKYTKIEINAPSKFFTEDLWINNQTPVKTYYLTFLAKYPIVGAIILLMVSSIIAGILAGLATFRELRKNIVKLGLIGLSNCISILGLLITTMLVGTKNKDEDVEPLLAEIKQKGYFWKRKLSTIFFFVAIPSLALGLFVLLPLIREIRYSMRYLNFVDFAIPVLIIYILPISALIISFIIKRIKIEDKNLFEQLKLAGYSSWSFQPKDKRKYIFVPVFSILFLIISWLLVKLVGFTIW